MGCKNTSPFITPVRPIKQGETLEVTGRLFNGQTAIIDWTGYRVSFMLYTAAKELLFSSEGSEGVLPVTLNADGTLTFGLSSEQTRKMVGKYYIEGKITNGEEVIVSDKIFAFEVIESRIGKTDRI